MKLLVVAYLHSEGGVKQFALWLARGLTARGHVVTIATPQPIGTEPWNLPEEPGIRIVNIDSVRQVLWMYPGGTESVFDCALVIGTGWKSMIGVLLNRHIGKRAFFESIGGTRNGFLDPRMLVHLGFDAIVGQATAVETEFCANFYWSGFRTTIPAIPHPLERLGDITRPVRPPPNRGKLRACYCGRLVPHKGVHWLIENWGALAEHLQSLDIWGSGPDETRIRATIAERRLGDNIRLRGTYDGDLAYVAALQSYDLEVLPTFGSEGAPLVLLEAMACGLPFVANGVGGIPDYANPDCRITNGDLRQFLPAVASLAEALYAGQVDIARLQRHYREHFSFEALTSRWEHVLLDLAGTPEG